MWTGPSTVYALAVAERDGRPVIVTSGGEGTLRIWDLGTGQPVRVPLTGQTRQLTLWVPLVVAAIGLLGTSVGTIAGVLVTQRRADRREGLARKREQQRERERWAREDALRTFEQR